MTTQQPYPGSEVALFVRACRLKLGKTQEEFGALYDCTKGNVSGWENGRHNPPFWIMSDMSTRSGVPLPMAARTTVSYMKLADSQSPAPYVSDVSVKYEVFPRRPKLNTVPAGGFKEAPDLIHPAEAEWIAPQVAKGGPWSAWLEIENDSMEPDFKEGDLILVDPDQGSNSGDFVVAANGDHHWTFKQLIRDGSDWYLRPLNPQYQNKLLTADIRIVGKVIEHQPKARKL
jgi:SOS-response transcriptional repressor LexA